MTAPHVLIVDDDRALLQALPAALRLRLDGVIVDTCDSAPAALERVAATDYDAIISDIKMPGMDGLALLAAIGERRPETPVLLISGHGEHELAVRALRGGAYDLIQKPIDRDYFVATLRRAVQTRQLRREVDRQRAALERHNDELERAVRERTRELRETNAAREAAFARERAAHAAAEAARQRLAFLAAAGPRLAGSLDSRETLATLTDLAAPALADWCAIDMLEEEGTIRRAAVAHADPAKQELARALRRFPPNCAPDHPVGRVLAGGEPALAPAVADETLAALACDAEHLALLRQLGVRSYMAVPLAARGRTLGALLLVAAESGRRYDAADLALAGELAHRAAIAIDNARLYEEAREAIRTRDQFLSVASHELRTPVTTIRGYAELLLRARARGRLDEDRLTRSLGAIGEATQRLDRLTQDLLDVSRLRAGQLLLRTQPMDLAALVRNVAGRYRDHLGAHHHLTVTGADDPCPVVADADRLDQVLANLLENAAKYSPDGGAIEVVLGQDGAGEDGAPPGAVLTVRDQGIGLPDGAAEAIFEPFGRAANAAHRQLPGLGLGLYICRNLVERHGGRIWAASPGEGRGTTFHLWLPLTARDEPLAAEAGARSDG